MIIYGKYRQTDTSIKLVLTRALMILAEKCTTPNNEEAECIPLYLCPTIIQALTIHESGSTEFLRKSNCGGTAVDPMVCCGSVPNFNESVMLEPKPQYKPISDRRYCGYQHTDDYFREENNTAIDEFPWMALIAFKRRNARCTGSLINKRYILTVASCFVEVNELSSLRLGEYNVATDKDCTKSSRYEECSDPVEEFGIEKIIFHPRFAVKPVVRNDIALIRLDRDVTYSDYIRPICLPIPGTQFAEPGDILTTSGWGTKYLGSQYVDTKKKVLTKLITNKECIKAFKEPQNIAEDQLCTLELEDNSDFSCTGDRGAPLIFSVKNQWHQEGIASYGAGCHAGLPDVHTKVVNYLDWIAESMQL